MNADFSLPAFRRKLESALSQIDQAIQGLAIVTKGSITIYDHDWPIRSVEVEGSDRIWRRVSVEPMWTNSSTEDPPFRFRMVIDAWRDEGEKRSHWHSVKDPLEKLPADFPEQFTLLNACWSEVAKITVKDLTVETNPYRSGSSTE